MELRTARSRSKSRNSVEKDEGNSENHIGMEQTIIRTTRSKTIKSTVSSDFDNITNINHNQDLYSARPVKMKNEKSIRKTRYKTSDYSSEEGDQQVSSTDTIEQNSKNQFLERMRRSVSRSSNVSALDIYRQAGDYWNKFPKTDYTYSPHSRDRTEVAPGVLAMPNMSRRSLHDYDASTDYVTAHKETNTESFLKDEIDHSSNSAYNSRFTSNLNSENLTRARGRNLFNNNSEDKYTYSVSARASSVKKQSIVTRIVTTITTFFVTYFTWISSLPYDVYQTQNSMVVWLGKQIHKIATHIMLWDTWLLQSSNSNRKLSSLLALCLIPLVLLGGLHVLLASGVSLAPPCHPHCGRIASSYVNSLIDSAYDTLHYSKAQP